MCLYGSGQRILAPVRPEYSTASEPGSIIRPRAIIGTLKVFCMLHLHHIVHEFVVGLRRTCTRDLIVPALHFGEAGNLRRDARPLPPAAAVLIPVHRDLITGDEASPIGLRQ